MKEQVIMKEHTVIIGGTFEFKPGSTIAEIFNRPAPVYNLEQFRGLLIIRRETKPRPLKRIDIFFIDGKPVFEWVT